MDSSRILVLTGGTVGPCNRNSSRFSQGHTLVLRKTHVPRSLVLEDVQIHLNRDSRYLMNWPRDAVNRDTPY